MTKVKLKKTITSSKKPIFKDGEEIKKYIYSGVDSLRKELIPRIDMIDRRDKEQYDLAKKIIMDANELLASRQKHSEQIVESAKQEIDIMITKQNEVITRFSDSLESLHTKLDVHITDENKTFETISTTLKDISQNGTKLARSIDEKLNTIKVNGGVYPLGEAFQFIFVQQTETHQKLDEVYALVAPMQARKKWWEASKELIKRNGLLHFVFNTKVGAILGISTLLLIINTILVDVFRVNFDIKSIFTWILNLIKGVTK